LIFFRDGYNRWNIADSKDASQRYMNKNTMPDGESKDKNDLIKWTSFGFEFCGVIVVFCYIGYKIDEVINSSPFFLLGGFFIGFMGMFYLLYKQTKNGNK